MLKTTKVPDAAFKALTAMVESPELLTIYGAMPADPAKQDACVQVDRPELPGHQARLDDPAGNARLPRYPQQPAFVPNYAKAKAAFQAFQNKNRTTPGVDMDAELATLKTTLQGIFDKPATVGRLLLLGPLGRSPARGGLHSTMEPIEHDDRDDRGSSSAAHPLGRRRWLASASRREAFWGFVFIGPWLFGLVVFAAGPDHRLAGHLADRLQSRPTRGRQVRRHRQLRPDGVPTRTSASRCVVTFKFALIAIPLTMVASLGFAGAGEQSEAVRTEHLPDAPLHADPDPARRRAPSSGSAS